MDKMLGQDHIHNNIDQLDSITSIALYLTIGIILPVYPDFNSRYISYTLYRMTPSV